jgi:hypothetical protein
MGEVTLFGEDELDYIHFFIATQKVFTCTEAARCLSFGKAPSHDAYRLLPRQSTETLWQEALVDRKQGEGELSPISLA